MATRLSSARQHIRSRRSEGRLSQWWRKQARRAMRPTLVCSSAYLASEAAETISCSQQTCMISLAQGGCKIGSSRRMSPQRLRRIAYRRRSPICRQWSTFRCMFVRAIFLKSKHHLLFIFRKNFTTKLQRNPALEFLPEKEIHAGSGGRGPEHTAVNTSQTHTVTW